MNVRLDDDEDFQALIRSIDFPPFDAIVNLAKKRGVKEVRDFWDLFDHVGKMWRVKKSCEANWEGLC
jgi:hypothetical protein